MSENILSVNRVTTSRCIIAVMLYVCYLAVLVFVQFNCERIYFVCEQGNDITLYYRREIPVCNIAVLVFVHFNYERIYFVCEQGNDITLYYRRDVLCMSSSCTSICTI
jgi:hypothetical protein